MASKPSPVTLETERLILWMPAPADAHRLVTYFETNRQHLTPWEPPFLDSLFTNAFWANRLAQNRLEHEAGTSLRLALVSRKDPDGPIVGLANFTQFIRKAFMACTLGYSLDQDAVGRGLMTEALRAAIDHVFNELGMHRIQANYIPTNERSGRVLRRLGFVVEGYARDYLFINGRWQDHILTALTNPEPVVPEYLEPEP